MKRENIFHRVIYTILFFVSVLFIPLWWVVAICAIVGVVFFPRYYECIVAGVVMDILYNSTSVPFLCTATAIVVYILSLGIKKYVRT